MYSKKFNDLKKDYITTPLPPFLETSGQRDLLLKLEEKKRRAFKPALGFGLALASFLLVLTGVVGASQASKPGHSLYSVKILSDQIYSEVTGDYEPVIDRRFEEIIEAQDEPNGSFDKAAEEYKKAIEVAREKRENDEEEEKERLRQKLAEQEQKFQDLSRRDSRLENKLKSVLETTRKTRGEVKGEKDQQKETKDSEKDSNSSNKNTSDNDRDDD